MKPELQRVITSLGVSPRPELQRVITSLGVSPRLELQRVISTLGVSPRPVLQRVITTLSVRPKLTFTSRSLPRKSSVVTPSLSTSSTRAKPARVAQATK